MSDRQQRGGGQQPLARIQPKQVPASEARGGVPGPLGGDRRQNPHGRQLPSRMSDSVRKRYADFLPDTQAVVERPHSPFSRILMLVMVGLVGCLVAYLALAEVDQVATAQGVVRPSGRVKVVNHPQGGRVTAIYVQDGEQVTQGQLLMELDSGLAGEELQKRRAELIAAELEVARLEAEAQGLSTPDFPQRFASERPDLAASQMNLFNARIQALQARRSAADERIRQRAQQISTLEGRVRKERQNLAIMQEQVNKLASLREKGYFPELQFLTMQRQLNEVRGGFEEATSSLAESRSALQEARTNRASIDAQFQSEVKQQLSTALAQRDRLRSQLQQSATVLGQLAITAPDDGIVQDLAVNNIGQAVNANEPLLKVVPKGDKVVIEARVPNDDISNVSIGQEARVKIATYNFIQYGTLDGHVARISPDAVQDERTGQLLFNVWVETDKDYLGEQPGQNIVHPGMTASVDLVTGRRTLLSFLTDRLQQTTETAFTQE